MPEGVTRKMGLYSKPSVTDEVASTKQDYRLQKSLFDLATLNYVWTTNLKF